MVRKVRAQDVVEKAVVALRRNREQLVGLAPCKVVLHLPPSDSEEDVALDLFTLLRLR